MCRSRSSRAMRTAINEKPGTSIFADEDEAFAKMRAGYKPDVMGPCLYSLPRWKAAGLLAAHRHRPS